jgi:hypothetical protein
VKKNFGKATASKTSPSSSDKSVKGNYKTGLIRICCGDYSSTERALNHVQQARYCSSIFHASNIYIQNIDSLIAN